MIYYRKAYVSSFYLAFEYVLVQISKLKENTDIVFELSEAFK